MLQIIAMQEEADDAFVQKGAFGEGEGFAHEVSQALAERVVKTFDVVGRPPRVGRVMLFGGKTL